MSERDIRNRLENVIDRWIKATPAERIMLVHEKIRLEEMLENLQKQAKLA